MKVNTQVEITPQDIKGSYEERIEFLKELLEDIRRESRIYSGDNDTNDEFAVDTLLWEEILPLVPHTAQDGWNYRGQFN